jgi:hypothetical protein
MSPILDMSSSNSETNTVRDVELAVVAGATSALRARAAVQRQRAADGTSSAGEQFPDVVIQTGEAAVAARLAATFERLAAEIETEAGQ